MPKDKKSLLSLMIYGKVTSFHADFEDGHGSTDYVKWIQQDEGSFEDLPCINKDTATNYRHFKRVSRVMAGTKCLG